MVTQLNGEYGAKCVVIATGTNLGGKIFVGDAWYASGPDGMHAANALTESLKAAGLPLRRFKTGTPARVHRRSIDFSQLECQPGDPDSELQPFSFLTDTPMHNKVECWIAYTLSLIHISRMGVENVTFSAVQKGEATIIRLDGEKLGALIGRRGETMESLSYLASLVANRLEGDYIKLGLDVAGYRDKRESDLTALAQRIGAKVRKTGRSFAKMCIRDRHTTEAFSVFPASG